MELTVQKKCLRRRLGTFLVNVVFFYGSCLPVQLSYLADMLCLQTTGKSQ